MSERPKFQDELIGTQPGFIVALPRSGTNWAVDVIKTSSSARILTEPLWLYNYDKNIDNPLHPMRFSTEANVSRKYGHEHLKNDSYGAFLTRNFLTWLSHDDGRVHLMKETDGFFHLGWLYGSCPELQSLHLTRDLRGNIASLKKGGLFFYWNFEERIKNFRKTIFENSLLDTLYGGFVAQSGKSDAPHKELAVYLSVASLEIQRHLNKRPSSTLVVAYEDLVEQPESLFLHIFSHFKIPLDQVVTEKN